MSLLNFSSYSERTRRVSKEGLWILLGQAAAISGSLAGVRILTGLLHPSTYGALALGMTAATLVTQTILGPLANGATRFYAIAQEQGSFKEYFQAVRQLTTSATSIVIIILLLIIAGLTIAGKAGWNAIAAEAFIFAILTGYTTILCGIQNAARQRAAVALRQGMEPWARFLFAALLVKLVAPTGTTAMAGYLLAAILVLATQVTFFVKIIEKGDVTPQIKSATPRCDWGKQIFEYSWPFATWGILLWAYLSSGRWALQIFNSTREVGYYAVLFQLGYYPFSMLATMAIQLISPIYFQRIGDSSDPNRVLGIFKLTRRITLLALAGTILATIVAYFSHQLIFRLLAAPPYAKISSLMPLMVFASGLLTTSQFCTLAMQAQKTTKHLVLPKNSSYIFGAILTFWGAAVYGLSGILYAAIATNGIHLIWIAVLLKKQEEKTQLALKEGSAEWAQQKA